MQFVKTDGGMRSSGFAESNDCAVRAYALFKNIPYDEAHSIFKKLGRRDGRGTKNYIIYDLIGRETRKDGNGMTLNQLVAANPTGRVYGLKRGHAFAIIDGVLHDSWKVGGKCRILFYWTDTVTVNTTIRMVAPVSSIQVHVKVQNKQADARAIFDRLSAYRTLSNYAIAKRIAAELNISVANAYYYVRSFATQV